MYNSQKIEQVVLEWVWTLWVAFWQSAAQYVWWCSVVLFGHTLFHILYVTMFLMFLNHLKRHNKHVFGFVVGEAERLWGCAVAAPVGEPHPPCSSRKTRKTKSSSTSKTSKMSKSSDVSFGLLSLWKMHTLLITCSMQNSCLWLLWLLCWIWTTSFQVCPVQAHARLMQHGLFGTILHTLPWHQDEISRI